MNRFTIALAAAVLLYAPALLAQPLYTCGPGAVRSVRMVGDLPSTPGTGEQLVAAATALPPRYLVTVELDDVIYLGVSAADDPWNLDPGGLGADEVVSVCASTAEVLVDRGDGTDYRAKVVRIDRRSRLQTDRLTEAGQIQPVLQRAAADWRRPNARP